MKNKVLIVTGEASGDLHAAGLLHQLKKINPEVTYFGVGGTKLREEGVNILLSIEKLAFMGFFEVLQNITLIRELKRKLLNFVDQEKPDLVILVDYPGFNLRFAKEIKKREIPIIYYISPQVWAWGSRRIKTISKLIDKMLVFFPFEEKLYADSGVNVSFIGHPLLDLVQPTLSKQEFRNKLQLKKEEILIGLLPGSRFQEIKNTLPAMLQSSQILKDKLKGVNLAIGLAPTIEKYKVESFLKRQNAKASILVDSTYDLMSHSDLLLVTSGTATLESAISSTPMIIMYKTSLFTYLLARSLVKVQYIGMVNIVAGEKIVPEFIQFEINPKKIAEEMNNILLDKNKYENIRKNLNGIKERLGEKGAYRRGAEIVNKMFL